MTVPSTPFVAAQYFLRRLPSSARVLVAISGGSDSTGLLIALHKAAGEGRRIVAATIDHALRPESAQEAQAVAALCATLAIPHLTLRWEGDKPKTGLSAAARAARYRLLKQAANHFSADMIVTAHTADDQDETILMRAARSGDPCAPGLSGMADAVLYDRTIWIARPFLGLRRQAIRDALTCDAIGWIDDPSNADLHYERVRMRMALSGGGAAGPDASAAARRRERLSCAAAEWVTTHVALYGGVTARIEPCSLQAPEDVLRFALSGLLATLGGRENGPSYSAMTRLVALLRSGEAGRMTIGRVLAVCRRDGVFLMREQRDLPVIDIAPGECGIWDGRFLVRNTSPAWVTVAPEHALPEVTGCRMFTDIAPSLARRAAAVLPRIVAVEKGAIVVLEPRIAPYDLFLPVFDLAFAGSLAQLFGREAFTAPAISR